MENLKTFLTPPPLPLSLLLLVTLNVINKSITTLIRGEGGRCALTIRMSEMTVNIASVSRLSAIVKIEEQGWRSGESTRLPPMWPRFDYWSRCHMWVEFVVGSRPCSERFFSGYPGFPLSSKTNISKFQFDLQSPRLVVHLCTTIRLIFFNSLWIIHSIFFSAGTNSAPRGDEPQ